MHTNAPIGILRSIFKQQRGYKNTLICLSNIKRATRLILRNYVFYFKFIFYSLFLVLKLYFFLNVQCIYMFYFVAPPRIELGSKV